MPDFISLDKKPGNAAKSTAIAFLFAYLSTTSPRILTSLLSILRKRNDLSKVLVEISGILRQGFQPNRFPTFCTVVVGGSTALRGPLNLIFQSLDAKIHGGKNPRRTRNNRIASRFVAALIASVVAFRLLNSESNERSLEAANASQKQPGDDDSQVATRPTVRKSKIPLGMPPLPARAITIKRPVVAFGVPLAGKTVDLTLFIFIRAADVLAQSWASSSRSTTKFSKWFRGHASSLFFAASSAVIMHAFFYAPSRLPYTYVKWIDRIAECDERLIDALRQIYYGNFIYGKETGIGPLLESMAKDYNMPEEWGNPAKTIPIPCELVHHGCGKSCEKHAVWRFWKAWRLALGVYAPLQGLMLLRLLKDRKANKYAALTKAVIDTARSSAFLGAFVSLFYYGVCLARTRLGPKIFDSKTISPQMWDSGLCVTSGCILCGWSVLLEYPKRQAELMLFVLPRALGVWFPRRYLKEHQWREETVFAISTAVVLTAAQERPDRVRGVFGHVLNQVMAT